MRIVLGSDGLTTPGGSETYLLTLGRELQRLGHEVHVMPGPADAGTLVRAYGLPKIDHPGQLRAAPDRIISQDAIVAGEAAAAWPEVPQLFVAHSGIHSFQLTSALPSSVAAYVAHTDSLCASLEALPAPPPIIRLRQPVDVAHFSPASPPRPEPKVALIFGNNQATWRFAGLEDACARRGIEVRRVGAVGDGPVLDPVAAVQEADIVVGYGRCIVEAMACGRTAFVYDRWGSDGWITEASYPAIEALGFAGRAGTDEPGRSDFDEVLDRYDPATGAVGLDLATRHHNSRTYAVEIVEVLNTLGPVEPADPDVAFTLARVWRESWRWEREALTLSREVDRLRVRVEKVEADLEGSSARAAQLTEHAASLRLQVDALERAHEAVLHSRRYRIGSAIAQVTRPFRRS